MKHAAWLLGGSLLFALVLVIVIPMRYVFTYQADEKVQKKSEQADATEPEVVQRSHIKTPEHVRALYLSSWGAGSTTLRTHVIRILDDAPLLNAVVVDIKDDTGKISYIPPRAELAAYNTYEDRIHDIQALIDILHEKGIYVIGRVSVFQDPAYAKLVSADAYKKISNPSEVWTDRKGLAFVRADAQDFWKYIALIADVSYHDIGFDEINFDYVRYPTDGNIKDINYQVPQGSTRADTLISFFSYLQKTMDPQIPRSVDIFGMTVSTEGDLGIGQVFERILPYFTAVAPMIYPSHYPPQFHGYAKPAERPYEIITIAMKDAIKKIRTLHTTVEIPPAVTNADGTTTQGASVKHVDEASVLIDTAKLRPWIQDFDYGAQYGVAEVHAQMKALVENGVQDFMVWDASNKFTPEAYTQIDGIGFVL